jgi:hypothetical protein
MIFVFSLLFRRTLVQMAMPSSNKCLSESCPRRDYASNGAFENVRWYPPACGQSGILSSYGYLPESCPRRDYASHGAFENVRWRRSIQRTLVKSMHFDTFDAFDLPYQRILDFLEHGLRALVAKVQHLALDSFDFHHCILGEE